MFNSSALATAKKAEANGKLSEYFGTLVSMGFCENAEKAGELFKAAVVEEKTALLVKTRAEAFKVGETLLAGFSWPKTIPALLDKLATNVNVVDSSGNVAPLSVSLTLDSDKLVSRLVSGATRTASAGNGKRSGAKLAGKPVSKATVLADYPGSLAAKILNNNGKPLGLVKRKNGEEYGENTRWAALEACKNDPQLASLLTFDNSHPSPPPESGPPRGAGLT